MFENVFYEKRTNQSFVPSFKLILIPWQYASHKGSHYQSKFGNSVKCVLSGEEWNIPEVMEI